MVGGWVRKTENKAQLRPAVAGALPELGNKVPLFCLFFAPRQRCDYHITNLILTSLDQKMAYADLWTHCCPEENY